ncbi:MAG TPA: mechanosensitive ion channel domain-containing protein [Anaerolineales bacterium]|nr:mechanosensitive ion channel domain-containing protein [Anaerolineales bacterium]
MFPELNIDIQSPWVNVLLRILGAVAVFLAGRWLAGLAQRSLRGVLKRAHTAPALTEIIARGTYYVIVVLAISFALMILGVPPTVILGTLGIVIVVAAVALRESLRDLAATVNFIVFQPFRVGDLIETNGVTGQVQEILLFNSVLITGDNRKVFVPNGNIQSSNLVNLSALDRVRLDLSVGLSYADGVQLAKESLLEIAKADARVLDSPQPVVHVMELGESRVGYVLRVYTKPLDAWLLRPALNERIKALLEGRQLSLPYSQLQLHSDSSLRLDSAKPPAADAAGGID